MLFSIFCSGVYSVIFCRRGILLELFGSWASGSSLTKSGKRLYLTQISPFCANCESISDVGADSQGPGVGCYSYGLRASLGQGETVAHHLTI